MSAHDTKHRGTRSVQAGGPHDAAAPYVVGALQTVDADAFEAHLTTCADCRAEVTRLSETAAELAWLAAAPPPPSGLRAAVLSTVTGVSQLPPASLPGTADPSVAPGGPDGPDGPDDLRSRRDGRRARLERRTRVLTLLVAAVSVLALALGGVVLSLTGRQQAPLASAGADAGLLSAPDARIVRATLADGTDASFVVSLSQNRALFAAHGLPSVGPDRTYQLWALRAGAADPDSTLAGGADVSAWFHGSIADADHLAVTIEPAGGSATPTGPVLVTGTI